MSPLRITLLALFANTEQKDAAGLVQYVRACPRISTTPTLADYGRLE